MKDFLDRRQGAWQPRQEQLGVGWGEGGARQRDPGTETGCWCLYVPSRMLGRCQ